MNYPDVLRWILNLNKIYVDGLKLSSLTYFDRMQFYEKHIKWLCSTVDKAYRRFYRIFTEHLVKVNFYRCFYEYLVKQIKNPVMQDLATRRDTK